MHLDRAFHLTLLLAASLLPLAAGDSLGLVAFGDSITKGVGVPAGSGWVEILAQQMQKATGKATPPVANAGVGGNTSAQGLARMATDVLAHKPVLVLVEFGGNDANQGISVADFEKNLVEIERQVREQGGEAVFLTFPPLVNEWHSAGKAAKFAQWGGVDQCVEQYRLKTREVAKRLRCRLFDVDALLRPRMAKDGNQRYILKDGVHLTVEANQVIADALLPFLRDGAGKGRRPPSAR